MSYWCFKVLRFWPTKYFLEGGWDDEPINSAEIANPAAGIRMYGIHEVEAPRLWDKNLVVMNIGQKNRIFILRNFQIMSGMTK